MKKQLVIIGIISLVILLVGAGLILFTYETYILEKNKFIGTWKIGNKTMELSSDWACLINTSKERLHGRWALKDNLFITATDATLDLHEILQPFITTAYYYEFTNNDRTLLLTKTIDGSTDVYSKQ
jgi:hypothetical protein